MLANKRIRLLTLTGAGGTGKTRLALELAAELGSTFDKVWFVDLTTIRDPQLVPSAVAQALDVRESGSKSLVALLVEGLSAARSLLILDNFEHVLGAAGFVSDLVGGCPALTIIATSREALGLRSEQVFFVAPLAVPDLDYLHELSAIRRVPSIALFEERAQGRRAGFELTDEALPAVAEICVRLDGLPLAIELAAGQVAVLSPTAILKRLLARAPLVATAHRDLPSRHHTLQATVAWSYDLLEPTARAMFRLCAVFSGGFTASALETVAASVLPGVDALSTLAQLVTKSLVRVTEDETGEPRFWLLETIREYASDQLELAGELTEARSLHADYYIGVAEGLQDALRTPSAATALDELAREYANFRAVFHRASETGNFAQGLRLAGALYRFWLARGPVTEARSWLETALPRSQEVTPAIRAAALNAAGALAGVQLDHERARSYFRESLQIWETLGDPNHQAAAYLNLGLVAHVTGQTDEAQRQFERAHARYVALGDRSGQARAVASRARLAREQGELEEAMRLAEDALELFRSVGDEWGTAYQLENIGHVRLALADRRGAAVAFRQALVAWQALGNIVEIAECLDGVASVVVDSQPRRAAHLLGAADGLREKSGAPVAAVEQRRYQELMARVRSHLREDTFSAAWSEGRALPLEKAVDIATKDDEAEARTTQTLSQREQEIAQLIARGQSNNEIADSLVVSIKTVETHIQHIFRKLNVKRRAEIAAWAAREGLI